MVPCRLAGWELLVQLLMHGRGLLRGLPLTPPLDTKFEVDKIEADETSVGPNVCTWLGWFIEEAGGGMPHC